MEDKKIYIIFSCTRTKIGKIIRKVTHYKFNHISISLDKDCKEIYSFARYNKNSPFVGGFIEESILRYKDNCYIKINKITVTTKQYLKIIEYINMLKQNKEKYIYNTFSALLFPFKKKVQIKNAYTCIDFALEILSRADFKLEKRFYTIKDLEMELRKNIVYEGYAIIKNQDWDNDKYDNKLPIKRVLLDTEKHFYSLIKKFALGI